MESETVPDLARLRAEIETESASLKAEIEAESSSEEMAERAEIEESVEAQLARLRARIDAESQQRKDRASVARLKAERAERSRQDQAAMQKLSDATRAVQEGQARIDSFVRDYDWPTLIEEAQQERATRLRRIRQRTYGATFVAVAFGSILVWIALEISGFPSAILSALGTGMLTAGTVGVAVTLVTRKLYPDSDQRQVLDLAGELYNRTNEILYGLKKAEAEYREAYSLMACRSRCRSSDA